MKINILTLFPEMFAPLQSSMMARAESKGLIEFNIVNFRDFSSDKHSKADDYSYGGGQGLVLLADPIFSALENLDLKHNRCLYMSPRGKIMDRSLLEDLSSEEEITILCGHYEGVDQRVLDFWNMEEVSIGDYILTGGEPAALVLIDAAVRMIPGVLSGEDSIYEESIYSGLLEYPQYTKPASYKGMEVPKVLLSGNHKEIHLWRFEQALRLTKDKRPDLFAKYLENMGQLTKDEHKVLENVLK